MKGGEGRQGVKSILKHYQNSTHSASDIKAVIGTVTVSHSLEETASANVATIEQKSVVTKMRRHMKLVMNNNVSVQQTQHVPIMANEPSQVFFPFSFCKGSG